MTRLELRLRANGRPSAISSFSVAITRARTSRNVDWAGPLLTHPFGCYACPSVGFRPSAFLKGRLLPLKCACMCARGRLSLMGRTPCKEGGGRSSFPFVNLPPVPGLCLPVRFFFFCIVVLAFCGEDGTNLVATLHFDVVLVTGGTSPAPLVSSVMHS